MHTKISGPGQKVERIQEAEAHKEKGNKQDKCRLGENQVGIADIEVQSKDGRTMIKIGMDVTKRVGIVQTGIRDQDPSPAQELRRPQ